MTLLDCLAKDSAPALGLGQTVRKIPGQMSQTQVSPPPQAQTKEL